MSEDYTEDEFLNELSNLIHTLEEQDESLRVVRRRFMLKMLKEQKGMEIVGIQGNVIFFRQVGSRIEEQVVIPDSCFLSKN